MKIQKNEKTANPRPVKKLYEACCVILISSFGMALLISVLLSAPLGLIIGYTSDLANFFSGIIAAIITMFISSYVEGYYNHKFSFIQLLKGILLAFATQVILVLIFDHAIYFSGPTAELARYVLNTKHADLIGTTAANKILYGYRWLFMIIAFWFIYAPLIFAGIFLGKKEHKKDFNNCKSSEK